MHRVRGLCIAAAIQAATVAGVVVSQLGGDHSPSELGVVPTALSAPAVEADPADGKPPPPRVAATRPSPTPAPRPNRLSRPGRPFLLQLGRLSLTARVVSVTADEVGALDVPPDVRQLGFWEDGAFPGARRGTVVIDGHVDSEEQGEGTLFALRDAALGDVISLTTTRGRIDYVVAARRTYRKAELPADVFAKGGRPRLVLITCGGRFDRATHHYESNVVVYALPA